MVITGRLPTRFAGLLLLGLLTGCNTVPITPAPPPVAPVLDPAIPTAAVPTSVFSSQASFLIALCEQVNGVEYLCWAPPQ